MTKLEEVARAMFAKFWGPFAIPWEEGGATHQSMMLGLARVAIEALREPTEAMLGAAEPCMDDFGSYDSRDELRRAYPAMIDAILNTKGE